MSIASAVESGSMIYLYDAKGRMLATVPAGSGADDGLVGYTDQSVSVWRGLMIYVYDARGRMTGSLRAG